MSYFLFSFAILSIFAIIAAFRIYRGIRNGFMKTLISLSMEILCIILSIIFAPLFGRWIANLVNVYAFSSFLGTMNASIMEIVRACLAMALSIVIFLVLYFLLRVITGLMLRRIKRRQLAPNPTAPLYAAERHSWLARHDKTLGAITGLFCAILTTMVVTSPLMGAADIGGRACRLFTATKETLNVQILPDEQIEIIDRYSKSIPGNIFYHFGGKHIIQSVAHTKLNDQTVYFFDEVEAVEKTAENLFAILPVLENPAAVLPEDIERMDALCQSIQDLNLSCVFLPSFLGKGSSAWLLDNSYWNILPPVTSPLIESLWDNVLRVCKESTVATSKQNLVCLLRIYQITLEQDVCNWNIDDKQMLLYRLSHSPLIDQLEQELLRNRQAWHLANGVRSMAIRPVSSLIFSAQASNEAYSTLTHDLGEAFLVVKAKGYATTEEVVAVYAMYVQQCLADYGVTIDTEVATIVASTMLEKLPYMELELVIEHINQFFLSYQ